MSSNKIAMIKATLKYTSQPDLIEAMRPLISTRGLFIRTRTTRPVGAEVHFEFKLADGSITYAGEGVVRKEIPFVGGPSSQASGMLIALRKINRPFKEVVDAVIGAQQKSDRDVTPSAMPAVKVPETPTQNNLKDHRDRMIVDTKEGGDSLDLFGDLDMDEGLDFLFSGIGKKLPEPVIPSRAPDSGVYVAPTVVSGLLARPDGDDADDLSGVDLGDIEAEGFDDNFGDEAVAFEQNEVAEPDQSELPQAEAETDYPNPEEETDLQDSFYPEPQYHEGAMPFAQPTSTLVGFPAQQSASENVGATPSRPLEAEQLAERSVSQEMEAIDLRDSVTNQDDNQVINEEPVNSAEAALAAIEAATDSVEAVTDAIQNYSEAEDAVAAEQGDAQYSEADEAPVAESAEAVVEEPVNSAEAALAAIEAATDSVEAVTDAIQNYSEAEDEVAAEQAQNDESSDAPAAEDVKLFADDDESAAVNEVAQEAVQLSSVIESESPSEVFEALREQFLDQDAIINSSDNRNQTIAETIAEANEVPSKPAATAIEDVPSIFASLRQQSESSYTATSSADLIGDLMGKAPGEVLAPAEPEAKIPSGQLPGVRFDSAIKKKPVIVDDDSMSLESLSGGKKVEIPENAELPTKKDDIDLSTLVKKTEQKLGADKGDQIDFSALPRKERRSLAAPVSETPAPKKGLFGRLFGK